MSRTDAFEQGIVWAEVKRVADLLAGGISVSLIPTVREPFINLPGLRGYWPMSVVDFLGNAKDHSGASSDLARVGAPTFGYDGNAFVQCGVANDYLAGSTSAQTVTGTEVWMSPLIRGLTLGCWVKVDALPSVTVGFISKASTPPNGGYSITITTAGAVGFSVTVDGTTFVGVSSSPVAIGVWIFVVGRFTPSAEVAIFTNSAKAVNTTSVPASNNTNAQPFEVGRYLNSDTRIPQAKFRDVFLCASTQTDVQIEDLRLSSLPS